MPNGEASRQKRGLYQGTKKDGRSRPRFVLSHPFWAMSANLAAACAVFIQLFFGFFFGAAVALLDFTC